MSQYCSRIHVRLQNKKDWKKIEAIDFSKISDDFSSDWLDTDDDLDYIIWGDCSLMEDELYDIAEVMTKALGDKILIIADTTNINVDPYTYCVYSVNGTVASHYFTRGKKAEMWEHADIEDFKEWFSYGKFKFTDKEKERLKEKWDVSL